MKKLVSIVLNNFNGSKTLDKTIDSVLCQNYEDFELIIVDDGSSDDSVNIIKNYQDERIKLIENKKRHHISYAINCGLQEAKGEYIARIDSDDIWEEDKLSEQVEFLNDNANIGACFTKVNIIDDDGAIANDEFIDLFNLFNKVDFTSQEEWIRYFFYGGNCLCSSSALIRKTVFDEVGQYRYAYNFGEDYEMWARIVTKYPISLLDHRLVKYRRFSNKLQQSASEMKSYNRYLNVRHLFLENYLDEMSKDVFTKSFYSDFLRNDSKSDLDIEYEKANLLLRTEAPNHFLYIKKMNKILTSKENVDYLEKKYNFSLVKFYELYETYETHTYKEISNLENQIHVQNEHINVKNQQIEQLNNSISEIYNSTSWKLTKPIRKIKDIIK